MRRYKCPFHYCSAVILCDKCHKAHPEYTSAAAHREKGCERNHREFMAKQAREERMLAEGKALRCSALSTDDNRVQVLFRKRDGSTLGYYMSHEAYDSFAWDFPATPEDYLKIDPAMMPAPENFPSGRTTKQAG